MLPDVVLLEIFDFYQPVVGSWYDLYAEDRLTAWYALVRVCRKWRNIVLGSPLRLNLRLYCVPHRTPVRKTIAAWPALPIIVAGDCSEIRDNEKWVDNIAAVFEYNDRICRLTLHDIRSWQLEKVLAAMQQPFPALTRLALHSKDDETVTAPVAPAELFLGGSAPTLQTLELFGIPLPGLPKLLLSATHLVYLILWRIPHSGYFAPESMVTCLSVLNRLEKLDLQFESPQSRPDRSSSRRLLPPTRTLLPVLTILFFKGVCEYSEDLVARIDAPLLNSLNIIFFHQLILDTPQLTQFISRTPKFEKADEVRFEFTNGTADVTFQSVSWLCLGVSCGESDWQLSFLTQICMSSFSRALIPAVQRLYIHESEVWPVQLWQDDIEGSQWLELLRPFTAVKDLYISKEFVPRIAPTLQELIRERAAGVLPALQTLFLTETPSQRPVREGIRQFVAARQLAGHPIAVSHWDGEYYEPSCETDEEEDGSS